MQPVFSCRLNADWIYHYISNTLIAEIEGLDNKQ